MKLAICNDIGEASYCRSAAAAAMCDQVIELNNFERGYVDMKRISERYVTFYVHELGCFVLYFYRYVDL